MLKIDVEYKRGILFVRLNGGLNKATIGNLQDILERSIKNAGIKYIMINCEKLWSIDDSSISAINKQCLELLKNDGKLFFCGINDYVKIDITSSELNNKIYKTNNEIGVFSIVSV